jgi:Cu+-exporting ATPase
MADSLLAPRVTPPRLGRGVTFLGIAGEFRGVFELVNTLRPEAELLPGRLGHRYELALLSGDNAAERGRFQALLGAGAHTHFDQSPWEKLGFIRGMQQRGKTVMMVGDGLNDAGALQQSDVGVAVVESTGAFSPASDVIIEAGQVAALAQILNFARRTTRVVRCGFAISASYNAVGIAIAATGVLSPVICAILMPLSSISVVVFACAATHWANRHAWPAGEGRPVPAAVIEPEPLAPAPQPAPSLSA